VSTSVLVGVTEALVRILGETAMVAVFALYDTLFLKNCIETDLAPLLMSVLRNIPLVIRVLVFKPIVLDVATVGKYTPDEVLPADIELPVTLFDNGTRSNE
jgi:hypothetical protein